MIDEIGKDYHGLILAVAHDQYKSMSAEQIRSICKNNSVIYDLKFILEENASDLRL